jgi:hypothetical protein
VNQPLPPATTCWTSVVGNRLVAVATACAGTGFAAVAAALEAGNRAAFEPTAGPEPAYKIHNLSSTSHSVSTDCDRMVAVVIATYEITKYVYFESDE